MKKTVVINFLVFCLILVATELFFKFITNNKKITFNSSSQLSTIDKLLGYKPPVASTNIVEKKIGTELIYRAVYHYNNNGLRKTPQKVMENYKGHMVFLGDSNTFGQGLNDNQTIASFMVKRFQKFKAYNYAFIGYGPTNIMALAESNRLLNEVNEPQGFTFYMFKGFLINRLLGTLHFYRWINGSHPFYDFSENRGYVRNKTFKSAQPLIFKIKKFIANLSIVKHFRLEYLNKYSKENMARLCQSFIQVRNGVHRQLPKTQFIAVVSDYEEIMEPLRQCFRNNDIIFLDLSEALKKTPGNIHLHKLDSHFSAKANQVRAKALGDKLIKRQWLRE